MTERQLNLMANACELSSRLRSGQFHELNEIFRDLTSNLKVEYNYLNFDALIRSLKEECSLEINESIGIAQSSDTAKELYEMYYMVRHYFADGISTYRSELLHVTKSPKIEISKLILESDE